MISLAYAGMNLAALYWVMEPWGGRLLFAGFSFIIAMILVSIRDNLSVVYALMTRIGVALGVIVWVFFLYESVKNELPRQQPDYFFSADIRNWLHPESA
jgi:multidrug transporter EmrE-like cation transporter